MGNRHSIITDLESFHGKLIELYNSNNHFVNRKDYFELIQRVDELSVIDFESEEKHKCFLRYINQPQRKADRHIFEQNFIEDRLEVGFLWMEKYISGIASWLK